MKMQLVAGRDWNKDMPTDASGGFIINEEAVKKFGWSDPAQCDWKNNSVGTAQCCIEKRKSYRSCKKF